MRFLADATVTVSGGQLMAITIGLLALTALQLWALVETVARRRWIWLAAIWVTFPVGTVAWLIYGRWRPRTDME